jgi:hypothetical protein
MGLTEEQFGDMSKAGMNSFWRLVSAVGTNVWTARFPRYAKQLERKEMSEDRRGLFVLIHKQQVFADSC